MAFRWALSLAALPLLAQSSGVEPTFRSATNLIEATAVVRDRDGQAVGNLTADDFELFDNGKRQTLSHFDVQGRAKPGSSAIPRPANGSYANGSLPTRFVAFVADDQNLVPEQFPQATLAAIRYLKNLRPGDRAAVVATSGRMVLEFTSDQDKLREALSRMGSLDRRATFDVTGLNPEIRCRITYLKADWILNGDAASLRNCVPQAWAPSPLQVSMDRPTGGLSAGPPGEAHQIFLENQVRGFAESVVQAGDRDVRNYFAGLSWLIAAMSHMPGERSIILLTPGMYVAQRFRGLQNQVIAEAVRARVAISGVDPRGVYVRNDPDDPSTWSDAWGVAETNARNGFTEDLTSGTGGRYIRGDNDIDGALRQLDAPPEFVYVLGFSPARLKLDGQYHHLRIALKRRQGLKVDGRRGYYAVSTDSDPESQTQRRIRDTFFSAQTLREIPVALQVRSSHKPNVSVLLTATTRIDLHNVAFHKEQAVNRSELTLVVGLFDGDGNFVKDYWKEITLHPGDDALQALREGGIQVLADFEVVPGRYLVRALVRDAQNQAIGTQSMGVEITP